MLGAFRNVADALRAIELDAEALRSQREAADVARQTLEIVRRQQPLGAVATLEVLAAQQADAAARTAAIRAQAARFTDTVAHRPRRRGRPGVIAPPLSGPTGFVPGNGPRRPRLEQREPQLSRAA
ncbi:hypothetical protein HMPREF0731_3092 [Pseudoroseomonas cervicalis ATCC 49957]|uniref:Outer membrane efflux protein n=1 Tax=Pseudoroseomonas cervicalis ATCC 49957 TaxID=525371 RepID=D5RPT0_9PROT|nr:hypothetical protein HMPREF0731_3092 [Pseudoroseomonas cervicalis ATCC 49957]